MAEVVVVSQASLFDLLASASPVSETKPAAPITEDLWYDDGPGTSVAKYMATVQHPRWLWCTSGAWVTVERHFGTKPHRWMAEVYLELPDDERTYWSAHAIFETQDEAAREAAHMAAVALDLLTRYLGGEVVRLPGKLRHAAAQAHADASPLYVDASEKVAEAKAAMVEIGANAPGSIATRMQWESLRSAARSVHERLMTEFFDDHGWREFAEVPHVAR
ncbi:hypothetical protein WMF38_56915 [Sorangium sp. So ce118]